MSDWTLVYEGFDPAREGLREALCTLGNGETTLTAENWSGKLEVRSALDGRVVNAGVERYRRLNNKHLEPLETRAINDEIIHLKVQTSQSELRLAQAARTRVFLDNEPVTVERRMIEEPDYIAHEFNLEL